ncbi:MAG: hypothetical protein U9R32_04245, partial [Bacteroidota bacterium]|nr:hypothetical protein [Bacteroidota bacterium]
MRKFTKLLALMMVLMMSVTSFAQQKSGSSLNECSFPVNYQQNSRDVAFTEDFTGDFPPAMWQNNILVG